MTDNEQKQWENEMPQEFQSTLNDIRTQPMPDDSLIRSLKAAEGIRMTKSAWKRGFLNMALVMCIVYSVLAVSTVGVHKLLQVNYFLSFGVTVAVFWALMFVVFISQLVLASRKAGRVLLDCGPHPTRALFQAHAVFGFIISGVLFAFSSDITYSAIAGFLLSYGVYWSIMSTGRLKICEHGIWQYWALLKWDRIENYRWEGTADATLMIQAKTRFGFMGRGALPVAVEQKDAVDELMQDNLEQ